MSVKQFHPLIFASSDLEKLEVLVRTPKTVIVGLCKHTTAVLTWRPRNCYIQSMVKARTVNGVALLGACLLVLMMFSSQRVSVFGKYYLILVNFKLLRRHFTVYEKMRWDKYCKSHSELKETVNICQMILLINGWKCHKSNTMKQ